MPDFPKGEYVIENRASGAWMQASPKKIGRHLKGGPVEQWEKLGSSWQRWFLIPNGDGTYLILNRSTGFYLDAASTQINAKKDTIDIVTWPATGGSNQSWTFEALDYEFYKIVNSAEPSKCLDAALTRIAENGAPIMLYGWTGDTNQQWQIIPVKSL